MNVLEQIRHRLTQARQQKAALETARDAPFVAVDDDIATLEADLAQAEHDERLSQLQAEHAAIAALVQRQRELTAGLDAHLAALVREVRELARLAHEAEQRRMTYGQQTRGVDGAPPMPPPSPEPWTYRAMAVLRQAWSEGIEGRG